MNIKTLYLDSKKGLINMFTNDRRDHCKMFRETNLTFASKSKTRENKFVRELLLEGDFSIELLTKIYG
jgi:hypothetical protein